MLATFTAFTKYLEVRQTYSTTCRIFSSLFSLIGNAVEHGQKTAFAAAVRCFFNEQIICSVGRACIRNIASWKALN